MDALDGRVAVVTGGASGIGFALAERFLAEGMHVVIADVEHAALLDAAERLGHEVVAVPCDVSSPEAVEAVAVAAYEAFGAVHVLCNNAGVVSHGRAWEQPLADWQWVLGVDLWGVVHGVRSFVPRMLAGGEPGHVVNTASIAGLLPFPSIAPYTVAKAGVVALSESLHHDLVAAGAPIGVSVLCPGVVPTRIGQSGRNRPGADPTAEYQVEVATQRQPPPTARTPAEVAAQVVDGVLAGRFWVLTHPEYHEWVERRATAVVQGTPPPIAPVQ